jgi:imidazolonepropionase-like amidohydrolase
MGRVFFQSANLLDGKQASRPHMTVVVEGDRIVAVAQDQEAPTPSSADEVYDLGGRSLMPGMVLSHCHLAYTNICAMSDVDLKHPGPYLAIVAARNAELLLKSGYTSAVGAGAMHNIDVVLKQAIDEGTIQGPRILACGRDIVATGDSVDCHPSWWKIGLEGLAHICDGPDEFRKAVRTEIKEGVEIVKLFVTGGHGVTMPADAMMMNQAELDAAVQAAHDRGAKARGHVVSKRGIVASLEAGLDVIDHADMMDQQCIERMIKQGTFVAPSLYFPYLLVKQTEGGATFPGSDAIKRALEYSYRILPVAHAAGVKLLVGDDFGASIAPHGDYAKELEVYVSGAGIPALDVLGWATRNGAELMGRKDELGTITVGKLADLLVINGDPSRDITLLQDRANLHVVMKGGEFAVKALAASKPDQLLR